MPRLIMSKFWKHPIPLPPLSEQQRIVEILDQADAIRQQRRAADEKAARILPALFYKMFGDPATNPKRWPTGTLGDICSVQGGFAFKSDDFVSNGVLLVRIGNLVEGTIRNDGKSAFLPDQFLKDFDRYALSKGDLLIALTGATTGKLARYFHDAPALLNQRVGRFIPLVNKRETLDYLHLLMQTDYAQNYVWQYARGFGQPNIAPRQLESMTIPIPPKDKISKFSDLAREVLKNRTSEDISQTKIDVLFSVLLHRAFTGDLTAKWREKHKEKLEAEMQEQMAALEKFKTSKPKCGRKRKAAK